MSVMHLWLYYDESVITCYCQILYHKAQGAVMTYLCSDQSKMCQGKMNHAVLKFSNLSVKYYCFGCIHNKNESVIPFNASQLSIPFRQEIFASLIELIHLLLLSP